MKIIRSLLSSPLAKFQSSRQVCLASIGSITIALSIFGVFLFVYVNLDMFLSSWNQEIRLIIYLEEKVTKEQMEGLEKKIESTSGVKGWTFVSQQQAWNKFKSTFSKGEDFLSDLDFNPLPASYNLQLKPAKENLEHIRDMANVFRGSAGVESVDYGEKWITRFETFMIFLKVFLTALGVLLGVGALMIISNTIKLSIISKKDEIELMLLIGATPRFIKKPYMIEGMLHGLLGAIFSIFLVKGLHWYLQIQFGPSLDHAVRGIHFQFISLPFVVSIFCASIILGWLASFLTVNQFLDSCREQ